MELTYTEPNKLLLEVKKESKAIPDAEFFNDSKYTKLREAWCASMFGVGYSKYIRQCEVAVNDTPINLEADFYLKTKNQVWAFQLTEVQKAGRRRGKDFKEGKNKFPYEPAKENSNAVAWVKEGIRKKAQKHYSGSENLNLLVYVNFEVSQFDYNSIKKEIEEFNGVFLSIWLITNTHMCSLTPSNEVGELKSWGEVRAISDY